MSFKHVARRAFRAVFARVGQRGCDKSAIRFGEFAGRSPEMLLSYGFRAIDAVARFDGVEIYFHDAAFAPEQLNQNCEVCFEAFPYPRVSGPEEHVLGRLLADCACASQFFPRFMLVNSLLNGYKVESVMLCEALVFRCDDGNREIFRHIFQLHPMMFESDFLPPCHLLPATDNHKRRCGNRGETIENNKEKRVPEEQEHAPFNRFLRFFQKEPP